MKNIFTALIFISFSATIFGQAVWIPKATTTTYINSPISFSVQSLGYLYTGQASGNFYAYDPVANTWTAKADFPGGGLSGATGFGTDSFGYIGGGSNGNTLQNKFYQYNPVSNVWTAIANYPDSIGEAGGFAIGSIGYVAGGVKYPNAGTTIKIAYAYNRYTNLWTAIDTLPAAIANGFTAVANGLGYLGNGLRNYEYNPGTNTWATKAADTTFSGNSINAFVINNKIYAADVSAYGLHGGLKVFDPVANTWALTYLFPIPWSSGCNNSTFTSVSFSINNTGYLGGGNSCISAGFWQYDTAHYFTINSILPDTICQGSPFSISVSTNLALGGGNTFYANLSSGNIYGYDPHSNSVSGTTSGTYNFTLPSTFLSSAYNSESVALVASSPAGSTQYYPIPFVVKRAPIEPAFNATYLLCGSSAVLLYRSSYGQESFSWWSNPPGVSDTLANLSFTPTSPITHIYNTVTDISTGCSITDSTIVELNSPPNLNIPDSVLVICQGTTITLGGTPAPDCKYTWTGGITSLSPNPVVTATSNATYHVLALDTVTQCKTSENISVTVKVPPAQTICFVTVDSTSTYNVVIWEKLDKYATDSFYIYRETSTNIYTKIAAVPRDSLSAYNDYGANPNITGYRYKISAGDTCGNLSALSPYHNTIHLQYLGSGNLIWNVYQIEYDSITPVNSFDVYIDSLANGNWSVLVNVPGNQYTATDINYSMHPTARYRIVANWAYSCTATRSANSAVLSNIIQISPNGINNVGNASSITLYPNPAKDELVILCGNKQAEEVTMIAADGKVVSAYTLPANNRLDVSRIAVGVYIAEVKVNGIVQRIKWVKL